MVFTANAAGVTNAVRGISSSVETQGRTLGTSVRSLADSAGVGELYAAPIAVLTWFAGAMASSASFLRPVNNRPPDAVALAQPVCIVDREKTRC